MRFADVVPGARFAWLGLVYTSRAVDGELQIRATGEVLSEVAATFVRHAPVLLDLTLELEDGSTSTLSVTEGHPFYVPGEDTYQPVGELAEGTVLRVAGGGEAVLAGVSERAGDFEVFNFEVAEQHNYFVGDVGVAVHNAPYRGKKGTTCPTLPPSTLVEEGGVRIVHYYKSNDHGPAHAHVVGGGPKTRIGPNGHPLKGDPKLTARQRAVVDANRSRVRRCINKIGRWLAYGG